MTDKCNYNDWSSPLPVGHWRNGWAAAGWVNGPEHKATERKPTQKEHHTLFFEPPSKWCSHQGIW